MKEKLPNSLLKHKTALGSYLDDMLHQATQVGLKLETEHEGINDDTLLFDKLLIEADTIESELPPVDEDHLDQLTGYKVENSTLTPEMFPLQCLMFKIGNNLMSMPLIEMNGVVEWPGKLTRLPHEPDWALGILKHRDNNVLVIDSAEVLQINRDREQKPAHILLLGEEKWGLTCDQIDKVVTLDYNDVQWNRQEAIGITLGIIRSSLSSLLNSRGIIDRLQSSGLDD